MCLAVPAKLIERTLTDGLVDMQGNQVRVSTLLVPDAKEGDWLLIHAGFAIQTIGEEQARETFALLQDLEEATSPEDG